MKQARDPSGVPTIRLDRHGLLFDSLDILSRSTRIFAEKCVAGIEADREKSFNNLVQSSALATTFVAKLGYGEVSKIVRESLAERRPLIELAVERGLLKHKDVRDLLLDSTNYRDEAS